MKRIKQICASLLIGTMLLSMASCTTSGIHPRKFKDYCIDEMDITEYDAKDFKKFNDKQLKEGVVVYSEGGDLFDVHRKRANPEDKGLMLAVTAFMPSQRDFEDLEIKDSTYLEVLKWNDGEDTPELCVFDSMLRFEDREQSLAAFENYMDRLNEKFTVDFDKLEDIEFYFDEDEYEGFFMIAMGEEEIKDQVNWTLDNYSMKYGGVSFESTRKQVDDICDDGFRLVAFAYLKGRTLSIVYFLTFDGKTEYITEIGEFYGLEGLDKDINSEYALAKLAENDFGGTLIEFV